MTKEQYNHMRKTGQLDLALFYEYYLSKNPQPVYSFQDFAGAFQIYFQMNQNEILEKMDVDFETTVCTFEKEIKHKVVKEIIL